MKRPSDQNVQKTRKKRKVEKAGNLSKEEGDKSPESAEVKAHFPLALELFSQVAKLAKEIVKEGSTQHEALLVGSMTEDDAQKVNDASLQKEAENVKQTVEGDHQKVDESLPQNAEENSLAQDQRVEENIEQVTDNVNEDTLEVAEILASNMMIGEAIQDEHMEFSTSFDLNIEDLNSYFNNDVFKDAQEIAQNVQETFASEGQNVREDQNVQVIADQNIDQNASNEPLLSQDQLSADPVPLASRSLPSMEAQLMAQPNQNINLSSPTMGSDAGASNFLISPLPTPHIIPSFTPPPTIKTTTKLSSMHDLFDFLNTFVT